MFSQAAGRLLAEGIKRFVATALRWLTAALRCSSWSSRLAWRASGAWRPPTTWTARWWTTCSHAGRSSRLWITKHVATEDIVAESSWPFTRLHPFLREFRLLFRRAGQLRCNNGKRRTNRTICGVLHNRPRLFAKLLSQLKDRWLVVGCGDCDETCVPGISHSQRIREHLQPPRRAKTDPALENWGSATAPHPKSRAT